MSARALLLAGAGRTLQRLGERMAASAPLARGGPYPVLVHRRHVGDASPGEGPATFDQPEYREIDRARLTHLASLDLPLQGKRVLDAGCGVGRLARFFVERGCRVVCVDARPENIASLRARYPDLEAQVADVEAGTLARFGAFDVVFCYGLLYHLENPLAALRNMASVGADLLILETMVCDSAVPLLRLEDESTGFSQALHGLGCRPSPSYVVLALNRAGFRFIYAPRVPPRHREFRTAWRSDLAWSRDGHPLRCIFVASRTELHSPHLASLLA